MSQDEIRLLLDEELARESPPPMPDLVGASVRQGLRMRRTRTRWTAGVSGIVVACLTFGTVVATATVLPRPGVTGQVTAAPGPSRSANTATQPPPPRDVRVPATPQGMLALLSALLPAGQRSMPARVSDGTLMVALNLDRGQGVGMVRLAVSAGAVPAPGGCLEGATCRRLPDGSFVRIVSIPDNCIDQQDVLLRRPDGVAVEILLGSCLSWNGTSNPPGRVVLSADEAIAIADDARWGVTMPKSLIEVGQREFPNLSTFS